MITLPRRSMPNSMPESVPATSTESLPPILAVFRDPARAETAVDSLLALGIADTQLSVVCPRDISLHFESDDAIETFHPPRPGVPEGAGKGGAVGALLGAALVVGLTTPAGVGAFVVAGPLFLGVATGAVTGGLLGTMLRRGLRPDVADHYDQAVRAGRILVAAEPVSPEQAAALEEAFVAAGAEPLPAE